MRVGRVVQNFSQEEHMITYQKPLGRRDLAAWVALGSAESWLLAQKGVVHLA